MADGAVGATYDLAHSHAYRAGRKRRSTAGVLRSGWRPREQDPFTRPITFQCFLIGFPSAAHFGNAFATFRWFARPPQITALLLWCRAVRSEYWIARCEWAGEWDTYWHPYATADEGKRFIESKLELGFEWSSGWRRSSDVWHRVAVMDSRRRQYVLARQIVI
jgi:hypothetical protein